MNPEVAGRIAEIEGDRTHGASWLAQAALGVINLVVGKSEAKTTDDFLKEVREAAAELTEIRPSMVPIANLVSRFVYDVLEKSKDEEGLDSLRSFSLGRGYQMAREAAEAMLKAARWGAGVIEDKDRLFTCSYSSTICQTFRTASDEGKQIDVVVAESESSGGKLYGEMTAEQLKSYGISVEVIPDNAIEHCIPTLSKVLVGADSILDDGSLINGMPTYKVASVAKRCDLPFYSVCETTKFDIRGYLGKRSELEEGFDRTPPELITGIITEQGIMKPGEVTDFIRGINPYGRLPSNEL